MKEILNQISAAVCKIKASFEGANAGYTELCNASGDLQLAFDVAADMIIANELSKAASVRALISEEKEQPLFIYDDARYVVAYDPLDGSSLFDVNHAVGSIFAVYEGAAEPARLRAAVYAIYGPRTQMVVCTSGAPRLYELQAAGGAALSAADGASAADGSADDAKKSEFSLGAAGAAAGGDGASAADGSAEEFVPAAPSGRWVFVRTLQLAGRGKTQAPGGSQREWPAAHRAMVQRLFDEGYRLRYSGAMVADLHAILCKGGGLFSYPAAEGVVLNDGAAGKLRALFEVYPFAYIFERAGGFSSDGIKGSKGYESLLALKFAKIHASTPAYFGSAAERAYLDESL